MSTRITVVGVLLAASLALCFPACGGGGGKKKKKGSKVPVAECGGLVSGSLAGQATATPDFTDSGAVDFYRVQGFDKGATSVTITLISTAGDADLYLGDAGIAAGSKKLASYVLASQETPPVTTDTLQITLLGAESPATSISTPTLADYIARGGVIPIAVWGADPATDYDLQVTCENAVDLPCGLDLAGKVPGSGMAPPDFAAATEIQFFRVQGLPPSPGSVSMQVTTVAGDANLYLGRPGMAAPSPDPSDWIFSSTAPVTSSAGDLILIDDVGLRDVFGFTNPTTNLQDYISGGGTIWLGVAGLAEENEYVLRVVCSAVDLLNCGDARSGTVNGSAQVPPDLTESTESRFFQIDALPPTATSLTISLNSAAGDADLHLGDVGILPGSQVFGDYILSSEERLPATLDEIIIDATGIRNTAGTLLGTPTILDYIGSAQPVSLAVTGHDNLTDYSLTVSCVVTPPVGMLSCGDATSVTLSGPGNRNPDLQNFRQNLWYELAAIPPGTGEIQIATTSLLGDVDLYLAAPDIVPGSQILGDYPVVSNFGFYPDTITVCPSGTSVLLGNQPSPVLSDYTGATENLSFIVAGVGPTSTFTIQVRCRPTSPQMPIVADCGSVTPYSVQGSNLFPPDLTDPLTVHIFEVPLASVQSVVTALRLRIDFPSGGDADMYLAAPGVTPGSTCYGEYAFWDVSGGAADWIRIRSSGLDNSPGDTSAAYTLADYQAASTNLSFAVAGWTTVDYDLSIICN